MAQLAIKGHPTRGNEVIEILEMLGGYIDRKILSAAFINDPLNPKIYWINQSDKRIVYNYFLGLEADGRASEMKIFTLKEFLEKYPYKIGDEVKCARINDFVGTIINARWDINEEEIIYYVKWNDGSELSYFAKGLTPYKDQETKKINIVNNDCNKITINNTTDLCDDKVISFVNCPLDEVELDLANKFKIVLKQGKYYAVRFRPQYPKTYEECMCKLGISQSCKESEVIGYKSELLSQFQQLLICRDAYWNIAGGWKPDWDNCEDKFCITIFKNKPHFDDSQYINRTLAFPTEEMRDAFYDNFKSLIEQCKELL